MKVYDLKKLLETLPDEAEIDFRMSIDLPSRADLADRMLDLVRKENAPRSVHPDDDEEENPCLTCENRLATFAEQETGICEDCHSKYGETTLTGG